MSPVGGREGSGYKDGGGCDNRKRKRSIDGVDASIARREYGYEFVGVEEIGVHGKLGI
jgi:hypothetical protein